MVIRGWDAALVLLLCAPGHKDGIYILYGDMKFFFYHAKTYTGIITDDTIRHSPTTQTKHKYPDHDTGKSDCTWICELLAGTEKMEHHLVNVHFAARTVSTPTS